MRDCPKTNTLATEQEILKGCETFHGVPLAHITDEFESKAIVAVGHPEPRRLVAALLAYSRARGLDPWDIGLRRISAKVVEDAKKWHLFYRHADGATIDEPNEHPSDWCVCDDCSWWTVESNEADPDATAVVWWKI